MYRGGLAKAPVASGLVMGIAAAEPHSCWRGGLSLGALTGLSK